jgi:creatinine amidohydrolase
MLALRPDLVDLAAAADFVPVTVADDLEYPRLRALGAAGLGWQAQDLHREGVCGDATRATADAGRAVIDHAARCLVELLDELVRFPLSRLVTR